MRIYTAYFEAISVSAVQDLISLQSTSTGYFVEIHEITLDQITQTSVELLRVSLKKFSGAYSIGSGGASLTPSKHLNGDAAATVTARRNDTVQTSGGTSLMLNPTVHNLINGLQLLPAPEDRWTMGPSCALVLSLDTAPAAARVMSGLIKFSEVF